MHLEHYLETLAAIATIAALFAPFVPWFLRWTMKVRDTVVSVEKMKTNELPHIHNLLVRICAKLGVDFTQE